ncbi:MAG: aminopeptidase [Phycisphaerales bacterium]|nr:aminopeptidase [Phycisphaerales bacterium]MCB9856494.1 aminopeptidase [Phycisphaerales bacterium]MCB9863975.1 aminopeptidase [Phycisphaerales bacterium]
MSVLGASMMLAGLASGCGFDVCYALHAIGGQAGILFGAIPVADAIADVDTSTSTREGLEMVVDLREFARDDIRLNVDTSFESFYDSHGEPVAFSVSALRRDALEPQLWEFPFFGAVPFLNYFDRGSADFKVAELEFWGFDAFLYELDAYSLAVLPNPVLSPMLERDEIDLATLVFHELTHRTIGRADDGTDLDSRYNESVATFVGRRAAQQYFEARDGSGSARAAAAAARYADDDVVTEFMQDFADRLGAMYDADLSSDEKLALKSMMFDEARSSFTTQISPMLEYPERYGLLQNMPENNAFVLLYQRYNEQQMLFNDVFEATGGQWGTTVRVFQQAAATAGDPFEYLKAWLADRP